MLESVREHRKLTYSNMLAGAIFVLALIIITIFSLFVPRFFEIDFFELLGIVTGWIFAITIALGIVSLFLSLILFTISGGNLRMTHRSQFWLIFGAIIVSMGGLVWVITRLVEQTTNGG